MSIDENRSRDGVYLTYILRNESRSAGTHTHTHLAGLQDKKQENASREVSDGPEQNGARDGHPIPETSPADSGRCASFVIPLLLLLAAVLEV